MANYKLFDSNNTEISLHNLQDKSPWCETGASFEEVFVSKYGTELHLKINPEKTQNRYAPDLLNTNNGLRGDLKTQNTPFFQARGRYGRDPQFAVTFNVKDFRRYSELYPDIEIYFWVKWIAVKFETSSSSIEVKPMEGIWKISFPILKQLCSESPVHTYGQRLHDQAGNARDSYVLNLNDQRFTRIK